MTTATKRVAKKAAPVAPIEETPAAANMIAGGVSGIDMIPLGRLMRAPENVRHTDKAVDVDSLADDIAAHGLLQNLIGYQGDTSIDAAAVYIVGGGRRLQALALLRERGVLDDDFAVPVLLRAADDAIALSLSENLAKRDMNPADEFLAFEALMKPGLLSPAGLAKKFGFSERYVKQRLRLAGLAPEILDAMRAGRLTIDAAMAYAHSQDHKLQMKIFAAEEKKGSWGHGVQSIRSGIINAVMTTGDALFKFVGKADYEKKGGRYEDDLFAEAESYSGRKLIDPDIVQVIAADRAHFQMVRIVADAKQDHPGTSDVLLVPGLRLGKVPKPPKGYERVERPYWRSDLPDMKALRRQASDSGMDMIGYAGINHEGKLVLDDGFFVPGARLAELIPAQSQTPRKSEAEWAAERRAESVRSVAAWLAAQQIRTDKVEGRQFWSTIRPNLSRTQAVDGLGECYAVMVDVFVTPAEVDAQLEAAAAEYDRQEAAKVAVKEAEERAAAEAEAQRVARANELGSLLPPPAVIAVGELLLFRWENGEYCDEREGPDADPVYCFDDVPEIAEWVVAEGCAVVAWWMTLADHDAAPATDDVDHVGWADDSVEEAA
ncbi:MAG: ParB/RepB/Spo0J family partition protein [Sphingobium sp.]|nr:ParB/RepB/Spo0J family partition protein [Sphingobium sp.]